MFFLLNKSNEEIRRGEKKIALRRIRRKLLVSDPSLRIIEGASYKTALIAEEKAIKAKALAIAASINKENKEVVKPTTKKTKKA